MEVYVKIKDEKHAEKVIKRLVRIGYRYEELSTTSDLRVVSTICVFDDGTYQLLSLSSGWGIRIKPKEVMNSKPVKYFMEHRHV